MLLELKNIQKTFKKQSILEDINLLVHKEELIHIIGSNGSGKSTIFKIICDIMEPDIGEVIINEQTQIGALIENPSFIEDTNVKRNLRFLGSIKKQYNESLVKQLMQRFELDYDSRVKLGKYSVGMRQKVGIIQAIMENQNLILLDEPTRGLDKKSLIELKQVISELIAEKKTVVIASHDNLSELKFDTRYMLEEGRLQLN
ncbi:MAG: ABC transporter ATP-binding protein [Lactobacillales bacterium]|jgi:ABC-2 type transport system ATP-binding protein|nr:ABC transporter ATP-binding protein [Lactobacillales bacterium]